MKAAISKNQSIGEACSLLFIRRTRHGAVIAGDMQILYGLALLLLACAADCLAPSISRNVDYPKLADQISEFLRPFFESNENLSQDLKDQNPSDSVEILPLHSSAVGVDSKAPLALILSNPKRHKGNSKYFYDEKNKHGHVKANVEISNIGSDEKGVYNDKVEDNDEAANFDDDVNEKDVEEVDGNGVGYDSDEQVSSGGVDNDWTRPSVIMNPDFQIGNMPSKPFDIEDDFEDNIKIKYVNDEGSYFESGTSENRDDVDTDASKDYLTYDGSDISDANGIFDVVEEANDVSDAFKEDSNEVDVNDSEVKDSRFPEGHQFALPSFGDYPDGKWRDSKETYDSVAEFIDNGDNVKDYNTKGPSSVIFKQVNSDDPKVKFTVNGDKGKGTVVLKIKEVPTTTKVDHNVECPIEIKKFLDKYHRSHKSYNLSFLFHR